MSAECIIEANSIMLFKRDTGNNAGGTKLVTVAS
jgi:hypothetical protein